MKLSKYKNHLYYILPTSLLGLSLLCIFNNYLWADETFSLTLASKPYTEILHILSLDMHPPLYFLLLRFLSPIFTNLFNSQIQAAKFVSFLPQIFLLISGFTLVKDLYGKKVAFLFNIFILSMPEFLIYAVEVRMYSLALLFFTLSYLYVLKFIRYKNYKDLIYMTIFTISNIYTNYFSGLGSVILYFILMVYLIIKNKKLLLPFFMSSFVIILSFLPWLIYQGSNLFFNKMISDFWIKKPDLPTIVSYIKFPFSLMKFHFVSYILALITFLIVAIFIYNIFKNKKPINFEIIYGFSIMYILVFICTLISIFIKPIFVNRYMFAMFGLFWLSIALMLSQIENKRLSNILVVTYIICGLLVIYERISFEDFYKKENKKMETIFNEVNPNLDLSIISDKQKIQQVLIYYYKTKNILIGPYSLSILYDATFDTTYLLNYTSLDQVEDKTNIIYAISDEDFFKTNNINISSLDFYGSFYLDTAGEVKVYKPRLQ